jgi:MscS family membrane protein
MFLLTSNRIMLTAIARNENRVKAVHNQTLPLFLNLINIFIVVMAVYFIFSAWHIDMTAWLASAGIVGIAVGFAAKDTLANLFSGVFIMADAPYKIGDYVVLDTLERGEITHIGIRSTRMLTRGDVEITIPNSVMGNTKIINESGGPHEKFRCSIAVGVAYGSDIDLVRSILVNIAIAEETVCADPEPRVRFRVFGASSLDFDLLVWIEKPMLRGRVVDILNTEIYHQFRDNNVEIPYSKQDLYIKELPAK